jgi:hypothetical protein
MSVINNFPAMPNRIAIACEYLHYLGEKGGSWDSIEKQLSPLKKGDGNEEEERSGKSMAEDVLKEMESLKLLVRSSTDGIMLNNQIIAPSNGDWLRALQPYFFLRLTDPDEAEIHGQNDLPDALAWLLIQDPFDPMLFSSGYLKPIERQLPETDPLRSVISNNSRYQNLIYWARYLGFAERVSVIDDMVIPDPSEAILSQFPKVFAEKQELPIQIFMQRLALLCPIMDGGSARCNFETRLTGEYQPKEGFLSRSMSLALTRLSMRGVLKLSKPSDAKTLLLDLGKITETVSHVSLVLEKLT